MLTLRKPPRPKMEEIARRVLGDRPQAVINPPEPLLTEEQAAEYLQLSQRALQSWRTRGNGPRYVKISGRAVRYRRTDLDQWIVGKLRTRTY
jgi:excisionase family DNA binding protein